MGILYRKSKRKTILKILLILTFLAICFYAGYKIFFYNDGETVENESGLTNIIANSTTVAMSGTKSGIEDFMKLAEEQSINTDSMNFDSCQNVTPSNVLDNSEYKIFKFSDTAETYIIYDNIIYKIGNNKRDRGVTSFALADINNDDKLELFYTYRWNMSGTAKTNVSYFNPVTKKEIGIDKNYIDENAILIKNKDELCIYSATLSNDENSTNFTMNAKLELSILVEEKGVIKAIERFDD